MVEGETFTAEELAFRAGLPLRTVRFYVQEKLIDAPLGRGPGRHFTEHHLAQLQQARTLQNAGFALDAIRERRHELTLGLHMMTAFNNIRQSRTPEPRVSTPADEDELNPADCIRIPMAEGIELMVAQDRPLPSPRQLVDLALYIRKAFGGK